MKNFQNPFKTQDQNIADSKAETVRLGSILRKKRQALFNAYKDLNIAKYNYDRKLETTALALKQWQKASADYKSHQLLHIQPNSFEDKIAI